MSGEFGRQNSGRRPPKNQSHGKAGSIESNLEKLGFLTEPIHKASSKRKKGTDIFGSSANTESLSTFPTPSVARSAALLLPEARCDGSETFYAHPVSPGRTASRNSRRSGDHSSARSSSSRPGKGMASLLDIDHRNRKDRTFIGGECAVCEEQLELTLRGERILQLSCGHISHEACFYEYLRDFDSHACPICNAPLSLDSSRGGSVPNIGMCPLRVYSCSNPFSL
jgi:hypothetical protein